MSFCVGKIITFMRTRKLLSHPMYPLESLNNPDLKQDFAVPFNKGLYLFIFYIH